MTHTDNNSDQKELFQGPPSGPPPDTASVLIVPKRVVQLARKILILVIGLSVVLVGVVMTITPGPALIVVPLGLSILATEFYWARRLKERIVKGIMKRWERGGSSS